VLSAAAASTGRGHRKHTTIIARVVDCTARSTASSDSSWIIFIVPSVAQAQVSFVWRGYHQWGMRVSLVWQDDNTGGDGGNDDDDNDDDDDDDDEDDGGGDSDDGDGDDNDD
jgi:hypothetical protein